MLVGAMMLDNEFKVTSSGDRDPFALKRARIENNSGTTTSKQVSTFSADCLCLFLLSAGVEWSANKTLNPYRQCTLITDAWVCCTFKNGQLGANNLSSWAEIIEKRMIFGEVEIEYEHYETQIDHINLGLSSEVRKLFHLIWKAASMVAC